MAKFIRLRQTLRDARDVQTAWQKFPDFKMGDVSLNDFTSVFNAADELDKEHAKNGVERTGLKAHRDDKVRQLNDLITRFRSTVRGVYGPDSALYQQAGGTRLSARKSPARSTDVEPAGKTTSTAAPSATATHA